MSNIFTDLKAAVEEAEFIANEGCPDGGQCWTMYLVQLPGGRIRVTRRPPVSPPMMVVRAVSSRERQAMKRDLNARAAGHRDFATWAQALADSGLTKSAASVKMGVTPLTVRNHAPNVVFPKAGASRKKESPI